jgi:hypothetical protein
MGKPGAYGRARQGRSAWQKIVLPVKIEECELPAAIADRLYADFTQSYLSSLDRLENLLRRNGANEDSVPLSRRLLPLRFSHHLYLEQVELQLCFERICMQCIETGSRLEDRQVVVTEDPILRKLRDDVALFVDNFAYSQSYTPERENSLRELYRRVRQFEAALPTGILAIANGLIEMREWAFFAMAAHWYARYVRNELLFYLTLIHSMQGTDNAAITSVRERLIASPFGSRQSAAAFFGVPDVQSYDIFRTEGNTYIRAWVGGNLELGRHSTIFRICQLICFTFGHPIWFISSLCRRWSLGI